MGTFGAVELVVWLLVVEVLALAVLPLVVSAMPSAVDRGYGISKTVGIFALGFLAWIVPSVFAFPANNLLVTLLFGFIVLCASQRYASVKQWGHLRELSRHVIAVEALFAGLVIFFLGIRFMHPEIFWGEKPMDSTFLHFFTRNEVLPPQDPWASGSPMRYYYLGVYFISVILKLTGIPASIGYNLAIATLAGLIGAALYSVLVSFLRSATVTAIAAALLVVSCNPEVILLLISNFALPTFDNTFWPSSRVFVSPGFFEYTSWSLLFADLHAHVIAIPFTVCLLGCLLHLVRSPAERYAWSGWLLRLLSGLIWGALFGINTWDFLTFGFVAVALLIASDVPRFWEPPKRIDGSVSLLERVFATGFARLVALSWDFGVVGGIAWGVAKLFQVTTLGDAPSYWGWVTEAEFNSFGQIARALGFVMVVTVGALAVRLVGNRDRKPFQFSLGKCACLSIISLLVLWPMLISLYLGNRGQSWALGIYAAGAAVFAFIALRAYAPDGNRRTIFVLIAVSSALVFLLEHIFLLDRMNTLFKGYMAVWMVGNIAALALSVPLVMSAWTSVHRSARLVAKTAATALICLHLIGTGMNTYAVVSMKRVPYREHSLDGSAYLERSAPEDHQIIAWFNNNVAGTPTVVESQGPSYQNFTRISMHTGLPTVLGWEYHVRQRGLDPLEVERRREAIELFYQERDPALARQFLARYSVDFVVVGLEERRLYEMNEPDPFAALGGALYPVASFGSSRIYVASRSPYFPLFSKKVE